jgi:hypothetical protein
LRDDAGFTTVPTLQSLFFCAITNMNSTFSRFLKRSVVFSTSSRSFSGANEPATIGFIGLGNMGFSMAKNLIAAPPSLRKKVIVFDMDKSKSKALAEMGGEEGVDIKSMAKACDVIITMLPASKHVVGVMTGPDGILNNAKPNSVIIDSSTIDPLTSRSLHEEAAGKSLRMIDAPVSGGVTGAAAGTLTFMVGGTADNLEASRVRLIMFLVCLGWIFFCHDFPSSFYVPGCSVCHGKEHRALWRCRSRRYALSFMFLVCYFYFCFIVKFLFFSLLLLCVRCCQALQ